MLEENIITHEVEKMVESVIDDEIISERQREDIHMTKRSEVYTRKRKRDEMEDFVDGHILKRKVNGNNEHDEENDELMETESIYSEDRDRI